MYLFLVGEKVKKKKARNGEKRDEDKRNLKG
jgi:hypothetical protein